MVYRCSAQGFDSCFRLPFFLTYNPFLARFAKAHGTHQSFWCAPSLFSIYIAYCLFGFFKNILAVKFLFAALSPSVSDSVLGSLDRSISVAPVPLLTSALGAITDADRKKYEEERAALYQQV